LFTFVLFFFDPPLNKHIPGVLPAAANTLSLVPANPGSGPGGVPGI
jgi:hypothetical protein